MKTYFRLLIISILLLSIYSCTTNIYLVRHAEKLNSTDESPLTPAGEQRAIALRDSLINRNIASIFASTILRTQLTARPLAEALHQTKIIYNTDTTVQLANDLKKYERKKCSGSGSFN